MAMDETVAETMTMPMRCNASPINGRYESNLERLAFGKPWPDMDRVKANTSELRHWKTAKVNGKWKKSVLSYISLSFV